MVIDIERERAKLDGLGIADLRLRYEAVFGEVSTSRHRHYLIKRILWRIQANAYGGLSEAALKRAEELANTADLRLTAPPSVPLGNGKIVNRPAPTAICRHEPELVPGTQLERIYKGQKIVVTIMDNGVRWNGQLYRSLTAVAKAVTGSHWNGKLFFGLKKKGTHG